MDVIATAQAGRKSRGRGAERRPEILAAAKRLFLDEGYERATMRRIAASVGVSPTALYVYFTDKDSILRAIAEQTFADMLAALEASQAIKGDPLRRFEAGLRAYVEFGLSRPDEYRLTFLAKMLTAAAPGPSAQCGTIEAADRSFAILQRGVAEMMAAGVFAAGDDLLVAEAIWACLHGTTALLLDLRQHVRSEPGAVLDKVLEIGMRGLAVG